MSRRRTSRTTETHIPTNGVDSLGTGESNRFESDPYAQIDTQLFDAYYACYEPEGDEFYFDEYRDRASDILIESGRYQEAARVRDMDDVALWAYICAVCDRHEASMVNTTTETAVAEEAVVSDVTEDKAEALVVNGSEKLADSDIKAGDKVKFRKKDGKLSTEWTVRGLSPSGTLVDVERVIRGETVINRLEVSELIPATESSVQNEPTKGSIDEKVSELSEQPAPEPDITPRSGEATRKPEDIVLRNGKIELVQDSQSDDVAESRTATPPPPPPPPPPVVETTKVETMTIVDPSKPVAQAESQSNSEKREDRSVEQMIAESAILAELDKQAKLLGRHEDMYEVDMTTALKKQLDNLRKDVQEKISNSDNYSDAEKKALIRHLSGLSGKRLTQARAVSTEAPSWIQGLEEKLARQKHIRSGLGSSAAGAALGLLKNLKKLPKSTGEDGRQEPTVSQDKADNTAVESPDNTETKADRLKRFFEELSDTPEDAKFATARRGLGVLALGMMAGGKSLVALHDRYRRELSIDKIDDDDTKEGDSPVAGKKTTRLASLLNRIKDGGQEKQERQRPNYKKGWKRVGALALVLSLAAIPNGQHDDSDISRNVAASTATNFDSRPSGFADSDDELGLASWFDSLPKKSSQNGVELLDDSANDSASERGQAAEVTIGSKNLSKVITVPENTDWETDNIEVTSSGPAGDMSQNNKREVKEGGGSESGIETATRDGRTGPNSPEDIGYSANGGYGGGTEEEIRHVEDGDGWSDPLRKMGARAEDRVHILKNAADKLVREGYAYRDPGLPDDPQIGIIMPEDGRLADGAIEILVEAAAEGGFEINFRP